MKTLWVFKVSTFHPNCCFSAPGGTKKLNKFILDPVIIDHIGANEWVSSPLPLEKKLKRTFSNTRSQDSKCQLQKNTLHILELIFHQYTVFAILSHSPSTKGETPRARNLRLSSITSTIGASFRHQNLRIRLISSNTVGRVGDGYGVFPQQLKPSTSFAIVAIPRDFGGGVVRKSSAASTDSSSPKIWATLEQFW